MSCPFISVSPFLKKRDSESGFWSLEFLVPPLPLSPPPKEVKRNPSRSSAWFCPPPGCHPLTKGMRGARSCTPWRELYDGSAARAGFRDGGPIVRMLSMETACSMHSIWGTWSWPARNEEKSCSVGGSLIKPYENGVVLRAQRPRKASPVRSKRISPFFIKP